MVPACRLLFLTLSTTVLITGCATPDLRLVSKPSMQFSEARGYMTAFRLGAQHEPGRLPGGAQASVCAYCR